MIMRAVTGGLPPSLEPHRSARRLIEEMLEGFAAVSKLRASATSSAAWLASSDAAAPPRMMAAASLSSDGVRPGAASLESKI